VAAELSRNRNDKKATSYLEVLETERRLFNVGLLVSSLVQQYKDAYVWLYKALGADGSFTSSWSGPSAMRTLIESACPHDRLISYE
jgi:outer membrane protein TolC